MKHLTVECLRCGQERTIELRNEDECARCGYVGWAHSHTLDERTRCLLRERPLERRSLHVVVSDAS